MKNHTLFSFGILVVFFVLGSCVKDKPAIKNKTFWIDSVAFDFVFVDSGSFNMGCTKEQEKQWFWEKECSDNCKPVHKVELDEFYIGKYEITNKQFALFIKKTNYKTTAEQIGGIYFFDDNVKEKLKPNIHWRYNAKEEKSTQEYNNHPVVHISWSDAMAFCQWLGRELNRKVQLPTEAQWEYAARGGKYSEKYKYSGSNNINHVAWYKNNCTQLVGTKNANELGVYDMTGNVWEYCFDWYDKYYYPYSPLKNPKGPSKPNQKDVRNIRHSVRGAGWMNSKPYHCYIARSRFGEPINRTSSQIGFRVVISPPNTSSAVARNSVACIHASECLWHCARDTK